MLSLAMTWPVVALAAGRPVDVERSTLHIHVGKSGLFSAAGRALDAAGKLTLETDASLSDAQQRVVPSSRMKTRAKFPGLIAAREASCSTGSGSRKWSGQSQFSSLLELSIEPRRSV